MICERMYSLCYKKSHDYSPTTGGGLLNDYLRLNITVDNGSLTHSESVGVNHKNCLHFKIFKIYRHVLISGGKFRWTLKNTIWNSPCSCLFIKYKKKKNDLLLLDGWNSKHYFSSMWTSACIFLYAEIKPSIVVRNICWRIIN